MNYLLLAQSEVTAAALGAWLELLGEAPLTINPSGRVTDDRCLLQSDEGASNPSKLFEELSVRLWEELDGRAGRLTVLVDAANFSRLDPTGGGWEAFIAMGVLAFPEVNWHFGVCSGGGDELKPLREVHSLAALLRPQQEPLFDGTGLRDHVRDIARAAEGGKLAPYLPKRKCTAVSMDDEVSYAYFNGLTAYRSGFRTYVIRRYQQAKALLGTTAPDLDLHLTFEDIFLNFPDNTDSGVHLSRLYPSTGGRSETLRKLGQSHHRVFVSSSQTVTMRDGQRELNRAYIQTTAAVESACEVQKPLSGMFDLIEKAGFAKKFQWCDEEGKTVRGCAEGFHWPPPKRLMEGGEVTGHGAPGRLLQVAEFLILRAEKILTDGAHSVREAVRGAVLATDALELLGDRTPTTAIQALDLKHNLEVTAECQFSGVEYHIEISKRMDEIRNECKVLSGWFHPKQEKAAAWNAEMHIVNRLVRILREHNQFDEENECMRRVRDLHNHLWTSRKPRLLRAPLFWVASYASWLMSSFLNFVASLVGSVGILAGLYFWVLRAKPDWDDIAKVASSSPGEAANEEFGKSLFEALHKVTSYLVGANDLGGNDWALSLILFLAAVVGLLHLGIFLSFLYSVIARKS